MCPVQNFLGFILSEFRSACWICRPMPLVQFCRISALISLNTSLSFLLSFGDSDVTLSDLNLPHVSAALLLVYFKPVSSLLFRLSKFYCYIFKTTSFFLCPLHAAVTPAHSGFPFIINEVLQLPFGSS